MNVYRCLICGDSYIGDKSPSNCPFCGAHEQYMVAIGKWQDLNKSLELSEKTRENVIKALEVEVSNSGFYLAAAQKAKEKGDDNARSIFKALAKVEAEHASVFKKILAPDSPNIDIKEKAFEGVEENFKESLRRETIASSFYQEAFHDATETRAKQVFKALVEVEKDHLALDKAHLRELKPQI